MTEQPQESESAMDVTSSGQLTHAAWANALENGDLVGQECGACGHVTAAPKAACARCGSDELTTVDLPTTGTVFTETTIAVAPAGFDESYQVAIVDVGDARLMCHIDGSVEIGQTVVLADPIDDGDGLGPAFEPA